MGDEPGHDRPHQLPVDNFPSNGPVSALPPPALPTDIAGGISFPAEVVNGDGSLTVKRKRGRPPKIGGKAKPVAAPAAKRTKEEEDVCFICFDGGDLVLCDRRDCPKAYHPACVKRDESFFKKRLRWNCGWHLCNICQRNAIFMCYTCPYSLCKTCTKQADISCVRGSKGFCKNCMATISLIENIKQGNEEVAHVDFDDTTSWEYLFKVYWVYLKEKESLTLDELTRATNPWKGFTLNRVNNSSQESQNTCINGTVELSSTVGPLGTQNNQVETNVSKRRKTRKQPPFQNSFRERIVADNLEGSVAEWASSELLEFVEHVKNGDTSKLTHFDVQALLLEYIRKNKLRDPHKKSQIICDKRLENLFGKTRVGHFEMLKLIEYHFKDGSCASSVVHAAAIDSSDNQMKVEQCSEEQHKTVRERKRQTRKKVDERERQINLDNFAAIDVHNMSLIYLKRSLIENLMDDAGKFHDKVVGSIVRIRISGNDLKQEIYRLVRVVGTGKAAEPYKIGDKTAHIILKILNLDKTEDVKIDAISNQDFSEDECRRLRQSIKCGLVERLTVGEVHEKAVALQELRIKDVLETEILKLNHLRDRASEMGHRKELRECVEKLEHLKSPEERQRRLRKIPEVHADPRMDPIYQSDEDSGQSDTKQDGNTTPVHSNAISRSAEPSVQRRVDMSYSTRAKLLRSSSSNWDCKRNGSIRPQPNREEDVAPVESSQSSFELETDAARILEELRNQVDPGRITSKHEGTTLEHQPHNASVTSSSRLTRCLENLELDKIWHYRDPLGKVQGPFCMMQLRKWNSSGYFPVDLRVWRIDGSQDSSMLLADALSNQGGKEHRCRSDCLKSHEARPVTGCRNLECGGQPSININAAWTSDKPNDGCNTDLTDAARCSDDREQLIADNSGHGAVLDSGSQISHEENRNLLQVASSPGQDISNACPASSDQGFATTNQNHKPECSDLPSPTPRDDKKDSKCLAVEPGEQLSAPNVSSPTLKVSSGRFDPSQSSLTIKDPKCLAVEPGLQFSAPNISSSSLKMSSVGLDPAQSSSTTKDAKCLPVDPGPQLSAPYVSSSSPNMSSGGLHPAQPSSTIKPANFKEQVTPIVLADHVNFKGQAKENKLGSEVGENSEQVTPIALEQSPGNGWKSSEQMNFFDMPRQLPDLNTGETKSQVAEVENPTTSDLHGQDLCTSWNVPCEIGISVPVSSVNQNREGFKDVTAEPCLTSNATCQDVGINWSTVTSLVSERVPWDGFPMQTKSCVETLDSGMKFVDHLTTTSGSCQFTGSLSAHPDCNTSSWPDGPIELSTLGDESVSDLLTEVEAYESLHGLPSPNLRMEFGDDSLDSPSNDCFSRLVGLSPPLETGKHEAWNTACELQFHSHPTITEPHPSFPIDLHNCLTNPRQVKPDFASAEQGFLSLTSTSLQPLVPAMNIQSSEGLRLEHVKPAPLPLRSLSFESDGDLFTSLSLSSPVSSKGPGMESNGKLSNISNSSKHEFLLQHHNPEEKGDAYPAHVSHDLALRVNLPPMLLSSSTSSSMLDTANRMEIDMFPRQELGLPPASATGRLETSFSIESETKLPYIPATQEQPACRVDIPFPPLTSSTAAPSSSAVEEGEMEPTGLSLELSVQIPASGSLKQSLPRTKTILQTSSTVEGELRPPSPLQHLKTLQPSSNPTPDTSTTRRVAVNTKSSWGASQSQGMTAPSVLGNPSYSQGNRGSQQPRYHGGGGRHSSGQRDNRSYRHNSVDAGFLKSSRPPIYHRQPSFNGSVGGGSSRAVVAQAAQHRGQRVCKFYESGYCKKGASCNYLHP